MSLKLEFGPKIPPKRVYIFFINGFVTNYYVVILAGTKNEGSWMWMPWYAARNNQDIAMYLAYAIHGNS